MRIISGKYGGRSIKVPKGLPVRPTTDRSKEALFNLLHHRMNLEGARVLDLFAGTGNISLECWSRGAASVVSVDQHARCVAAIKGSLAQLGITGGKVIRQPVARFLAQASGPYDLIFMDPPYAMPGQESLVQQIFAKNLLAEDGWLVIEHGPQRNFSSLPGFEFVRKYGDSQMSFFSNSA